MPKANRKDEYRAMLPALVDLSFKGARMMPVESDSMQPTLRIGDAVGVMPCDRYEGEGVYVLMDYGAVFLRRVQSRGRGDIHLYCDNKVYPAEDISVDRFKELVVGRVHVFCQFVG